MTLCQIYKSNLIAETILKKKIKLSDVDTESCETELLTELQLKIAKLLVSRINDKE